MFDWYCSSVGICILRYCFILIMLASSDLLYRLTNGQDFFTSYDEVYDSFDAMGLQENLLRCIYAYGKSSSALLIHFHIIKF
ncbi:putative RNA helicase [Helianthus anomalus]